MYLEGGANPPGGHRAAAAAAFIDVDDDDNVYPITILEKVLATQGIWFLPEIDRPTAEIYLRDFEIGVFIIRASSLARTLALSVNIPLLRLPAPDQTGFGLGGLTGKTTPQIGNGDSDHLTCRRVEHYLIESTGQQELSLEGSDVSFAGLSGLVHYYTENRLVNLDCRNALCGVSFFGETELKEKM